MLKALSHLPEVEKLERFLLRLLEKRGAEIEFVILFGSMAKGNWSASSDYDLLIGLRGEDGQRLIERLGEFLSYAEGDLQPFPYSRSEWERMFREYHPLLLEALEHGVVLHDLGAFARMKETFREWRESGRVCPWRSGWKIAEAV